MRIATAITNLVSAGFRAIVSKKTVTLQAPGNLPADVTVTLPATSCTLQAEITPADITGTANRLDVTGGTGAALAAVSVDVNTDLLPSPVSGDIGYALIATAADESTWTPRAYTAALSWAGSPGSYIMQITGATHGQGLCPRIQVYEESLGTLDPVVVETHVDPTSGLVSLVSNENFTGQVSIQYGGVPSAVVPPVTNLVTNGTFDSSSGWTTNGWTIAGGVASIAASSLHQLIQSNVFPAPGNYQLTLTLKNRVAGSVCVADGITVVSNAFSTDGVHTQTITVEGTSLNIASSGVTGGSDFYTGEIDDIIVEAL